MTTLAAMNIAIIGGGAAGMACAYLLDQAHDVTVFERQPILGGNVRTLGRNVVCERLPDGVTLDSGVIEFSPEHFPTFHRFMRELDIELAPLRAATGFIRRDGSHLRSPGKIASAPHLPRRWWQYARLLPLAPPLWFFRRRALAASEDALYLRPLAAYLGFGSVAEWLRLVMVYAYSLPRTHINHLPAALAVPTLAKFTGAVSWTRVVGGVYRYIERIMQRLRGRVVTSARIDSVRRTDPGVVLDFSDGSRARFDKVIIATTPEQVLRLLGDPSDAERRRFRAWQGHDAAILIHDDCGMYERRGIADYSEFDVFEQPAGYNAYLNRLSGLPTNGTAHYHLSYNLHSEVAPQRVLHQQQHRTPLYTVRSLATRREIIAANGERDTYVAGAWLGNGLHEGAVVSAQRVAKLLGGRQL